MASNEDKIDSILDKMQQNNDPVALSEGLNILCKLTAKYIINYLALSAIHFSISTEASRLPIIPSKIKSCRSNKLMNCSLP